MCGVNRRKLTIIIIIIIIHEYYYGGAVALLLQDHLTTSVSRFAGYYIYSSEIYSVSLLFSVF